MRVFAWRFDEQRLLWVAALLVLAGAFFYFKLSRLPKEVLVVSQWTGITTVYAFFSRLLFYGWAIGVLSFVRRRSAFSLGIVVFGATFILDRILFGGRRQVLVEFLLTILIALWFQRRITAPRVLALAAAVGAGLALASTGDYRSVSTNEDATWSQVEKIHIIDNFIDLLQNGGPEIINAIWRIDFADRSQSFDFGALHWNILVFNYVPAQFVGRDFKESLMFPVVEDRDYDPLTGTTETGMTDAFVSFWYFGAIKFFLIAYMLGRVYRAAMAGSAFAQILYTLSAATSMMVITHHTQWIISDWVQMAIFLLPLLAFARIKDATAPPEWHARGDAELMRRSAATVPVVWTASGEG
jgi:hypothetical protein